MEFILVGNLFIVSQIQTKEAARMRDHRISNAHRHPVFVDALKLIEIWVHSENEQEKLLENLIFLSKKCNNRHISITSMLRLNFWSGLVTFTYIP